MKAHSVLYYALAAALMGMLLLLLSFLYFPPYDYSLRQTAGRREFGSVMQTLADPYYEAVDSKLRALAESRGDVLVSRDARQRGEKQLEQIYELISRKPDGIFVSAVDWQQLEPALEAAEKAGIPVIALDAESGLGRTAATVSTDPYQAGALCAEDLLSRTEGCPRVLVLGQEGNRYSDQFVRGFRETLGTRGEIAGEGNCARQLAAGSRVCEALLGTAGPVDAVVAVNDQAAIGALASLERRGLAGQVLLYGVDGSPQARSAVWKGLMAGTVARHPYDLAQLASDAMYTLLEDGALAEPAMQVNIMMINAENIAGMELASWQ